MLVQPLELPRHFPIARGHVKQADHGDDRRVGSAQQEQKKDNADDPPENDSETRAE